MFCNMHLWDTDHLIAAWDTNWNSLYQFYHGWTSATIQLQSPMIQLISQQKTYLVNLYGWAPPVLGPQRSPQKMQPLSCWLLEDLPMHQACTQLCPCYSSQPMEACQSDLPWQLTIPSHEQHCFSILWLSQRYPHTPCGFLAPRPWCNTSKNMYMDTYWW